MRMRIACTVAALAAALLGVSAEFLEGTCSGTQPVCRVQYLEVSTNPQTGERFLNQYAFTHIKCDGPCTHPKKQCVAELTGTEAVCSPTDAQVAAARAALGRRNRAAREAYKPGSSVVVAAAAAGGKHGRGGGSGSGAEAGPASKKARVGAGPSEMSTSGMLAPAAQAPERPTRYQGVDSLPVPGRFGPARLPTGDAPHAPRPDKVLDPGRTAAEWSRMSLSQVVSGQAPAIVLSPPPQSPSSPAKKSPPSPPRGGGGGRRLMRRGVRIGRAED